jgi:acid phosphatase type 7
MDVLSMRHDDGVKTSSAATAARPRSRPGVAVGIFGLVVLVIAALVLGAGPATADPVFGDDFETGDLSRWTTVTGLTVQQQEVFAGSWAARGTSSGTGTNASAQRTLSATQSDVTVRLRVKPLTISGSSVNFVKLRTATGTAIAELFLNANRQLGYRNDVTASSTTSSTLLALGTWNDVTFRIAVNGTASTLQVTLNGAAVPALTTTTANLGTTPVGRIQLGENLTGRVYDFSYDDLTVDNPTTTPPTTTAPPPTTTAPPTTTPPPSPGDPVLAAAGDIACDPLSSKFGGTDPNACREGDVAQLIASDPSVTAVAVLGDVQYECGGLAAFQQSYDRTWGVLKAITHPAVGNHEYTTPTTSATDCDTTGMAAGYFTYFGAAAGDPTKGYYSYDLGAWHIIVLNTTCSKAGGCGSGSPQETWLRNDLAAHGTACTLAYFHIPLWSSGGRDASNARTFTQDLVDARADVILTGHDHIYERFGLQNASGAADPNGVRAFVVGTGGKNHTSEALVFPNSQVRNYDTFGFLKLTLHSASYDWKFVPEPGKTFTDTGSEGCR